MCGASAIALLPDLAVMLFRRYFRPGVATLLQVGSLFLCCRRKLAVGAVSCRVLRDCCGMGSYAFVQVARGLGKGTVPYIDERVEQR
jgi:hypothetical protein